MDVSTAIAEFADMLEVGSTALERLAQREQAAGLPETQLALLGETHAIARRLAAIAEEMRRRAAL